MAFAEGGLSPYPAWQRGDVEDVVPERLFPT